VAFTVATDHRLADGALSSVSGDGTIDLSSPERSTLDIHLDLQPLAVPAVRPWLPGVDLVGEVRGPMSAQGRLDDLRLVADLRTPRGLLNFDGRFDVESEVQTYDARLQARNLQMSQWIDGGPETSLAVEGRVVGVGTDPATLRARFDLVILPSLFEGARVDSSLIRFTLSEGLAVADTFALRTSAGAVDGRGSFGLTSETSGSLILDAEMPDLATWNDWIVPGRNPARATDDVSDLFAQFDVADAEPQTGEPEPTADPAAPDTIAGRASARGVLYGNIDQYSFGGRANAHAFEYAGHGADSLQLTVDVPDPRALGTVTARVEAENATVFGRFLDDLNVRWERHDAARSDLQLSARRDTSVSFVSTAALDWTDEARRVRIDRLDVQLGQRNLALRDTAVVVHGQAGFTARDVTLLGSGGALFQVDGSIPDSGQAQLDIAARGIRLENALEFLGNPRDLTGELTFGATVRGTADAPLWDAHLDISEPSIEGISYDGLTGDFSYSGRRLAVALAVTARGLELGRLDGFLRTDLSMRKVERRLLDDPLSLTVVVDSMPLDALGIGFTTIQDVTGYARGRVDVTGEPSALQFDGDTQIHRTAMFVPGLGIRLQGIEGRVVYAGTLARIDTLSVRSSAGGSANVKGTLGLENLSDVDLDLDLRAERFRGLDRRTASVRLDGSGKLGGSYRSPELTGRFRLSEGDIRTERFLRQRQAVDLSDPAIYALIDTTIVMEQQLFEAAQNPFLQNLRMKTRFEVGPAMWLRSEALEVEL
ncbi:MAG: translocation/assembly module TamB domain-containing protein, partial [Gemmatimonadota bacterium]